MPTWTMDYNMPKETLSITELKKLPLSFYKQNDVLKITGELLGKILVTNFEGHITAGRIVEAEAYNGPNDKASHAYNNRRTKRTEVMYANGGVAYVYLCYGLHQMFNIVTNVQNVPNAILIRAIEPIEGIDIMLKRTGKAKHAFDLTRGPGNVGKAMGLHTSQSGYSLDGQEIFIVDDGTTYSPYEIMATPRIGVDYAAEDALLPYRLFVKGNKYVSGKKDKKAII